MDNLAREAMLAKKAKMSYGRWKAMQEHKEERKTKLAEGWKLCEYCGKPFKPKTKRLQRFCESYCQQQAYYEANRSHFAEKGRKWREAQKEKKNESKT